MEEIIKKYWWVLLLAGGLLVVITRKSGGGVSVSQIGTGSDNATLAQIKSAENQQENQQRLSLVSDLLGYDLSLRNLDQSLTLTREQFANQIELTKINAEAAANSTNSSNALTQYLANLQNQQQLAYLRSANSQQNQQNWFNLLGQGLQSVPQWLQIFGVGNSSNSNSNGGGGGFGSLGGWGTPTFNPSFSFGF